MKLADSLKRIWMLFTALLPTLLLSIASLVFASCSQGGGGGSEIIAGAAAPVPPSPPFGLTERIEVKGLNFPAGLPEPGAFTKVNAFPNLAWAGAQLVALTAPPDGTNRICVVDRQGTIFIFENDPDVANEDKQVFLDIEDRVEFEGEEGLLGLAFDPDYSNSGYFFLFYTIHTPERRSRVSRFEVSANDSNAADPDSEKVILEFSTAIQFHKGGNLAFGPDGMLYISVGDNGTPANGQARTELFGSILRIQPTEDGYAIPAGNPFVGEGNGVREEIYAYGLRNPWRFSFDRLTGELWLGDVGESRREEVNIVHAGDNLGWNIYEGTVSHSNPGSLPLSDFAAPLLEYDHGADGGISVIGGFVYRGTKLKSLQGAYVYGDYSGPIWALVYDGQQAVSNTEIEFDGSMVSFGEDENGEIYLVNINGAVRKLIETEEPPPEQSTPVLLSETGAFSDLATLTPAAGIIEYGLNTPQWADGARIRRWIALPGREKIAFSADEPWKFPVGTVLLLHMEINLAPGNVKRLEMRVLVHRSAGWAGSIYRWNEEGTDAELLTESASEKLLLQDPSAPGGERNQTWHYPGPQLCYRCHHDSAGFVIGVKTGQLNGDFNYGEVVDNQLRSWSHIGLFDPAIDDPGAYPRIPNAWDATEPIAARARAYLDVNCAHCHQPNTSVPVDFDIRFGTPIEETNLIDVPASHGDLGLAGAKRIVVGDKEKSVLWERIRRLDDERMPPLGSHEVDQAAVDLIGEWIDAGSK